MMLSLVGQNQRLTVEILGRENFGAADIKKHATAATLLESVVNTKEFVARAKALPLRGLNGLTKDQLIALIFSGAEVLSPEVDHRIDVLVEAYRTNNRTVGYTYPNTVKTWVNLKFFDQYNFAEVACNLFHEWLHKLGFDHESASDHDSVPYALGYLVEDMINELQAGVKFTPLDGLQPVEPIKLPPPKEKVWVCRRKWLFFKTCGWEYPAQGQCHARRKK